MTHELATGADHVRAAWLRYVWVDGDGFPVVVFQMKEGVRVVAPLMTEETLLPTEVSSELALALASAAYRVCVSTCLACHRSLCILPGIEGAVLTRRGSRQVAVAAFGTEKTCRLLREIVECSRTARQARLHAIC